MPRYLNTIGNSSVAIGICGRCSRKFAIVDLEPDPNSPGLMVCREDKDWLDPYRLPPHEVETITLTMPRPDDPILTTTVIPGSPQWTPQDAGGQGAGKQLPPTGNNS